MRKGLSLGGLLLACALTPSHAITKSDLRFQVSSITDIPYICRQAFQMSTRNKPGCGDTTFWALVSTKDTLFHELIDLVDDTTSTQVEVPNFGGRYAVGDAALAVLQEILWDIHPLRLVGLQPSSTCGYCTYWEFVRASKANRDKLERKLKAWYAKKKRWMGWVPGNQFGTCDCRGVHPSGGHFRIETGK